MNIKNDFTKISWNFIFVPICVIFLTPFAILYIIGDGIKYPYKYLNKYMGKFQHFYLRNVKRNHIVHVWNGNYYERVNDELLTIPEAKKMVEDYKKNNIDAIWS